MLKIVGASTGCYSMALAGSAIGSVLGPPGMLLGLTGGAITGIIGGLFVGDVCSDMTIYGAKDTVKSYIFSSFRVIEE